MRLRWVTTLILFIGFVGCKHEHQTTFKHNLPDFLLGEFTDDYENTYSISDSVFVMGSETTIHILKMDLDNHFFIGQNDSSNMYDPGKYSRIDWIELEDMKPYSWAFCMSAYNAASPDSIMVINNVAPNIPKTGCNGFPYSRMKSIKK